MNFPGARVLGVWLLLAALMSANGAFRELVLMEALAPRTAEFVSVVFGLVIILMVTGIFFRRLATQSTATLVTIGVLLVVMTVAFEFLLGHYGEGKRWSELAGSYAIWRGELWPVVVVVIGLTPLIWGRWLASRKSAH